MKIYKCILPDRGSTYYSLPRTAQILTVDLDEDGNVCFWAEVDENDFADQKGRNFLCLFTGEDAPDPDEFM